MKKWIKFMSCAGRGRRCGAAGMGMLCVVLALCLSGRAWGASFLFAGDMTPAWRIEVPTSLYSDKAIDVLLQYDAFIWNCETSGPSSQIKPNQYIFMTDENRLRPLLLSNSIAMVANNHIFDGYAEGAEQVLAYLNRSMIPYAGLVRGRVSGEELALAASVRQRLLFEERDVIVFGTSPMLPQWVETFSVPRPQDIAAAIRRIREQDVDSLVFVYLHDGLESQAVISERQSGAARLLAAAGADAVVFAHSHITMPVEYLGNTLVCWGLGNAIFGGNMGWKNRALRFLELRIEPGVMYAPAGQGGSRVKFVWKPFFTRDWQLQVGEEIVSSSATAQPTVGPFQSGSPAR